MGDIDDLRQAVIDRARQGNRAAIEAIISMLPREPTSTARRRLRNAAICELHTWLLAAFLGSSHRMRAKIIADAGGALERLRDLPKRRPHMTKGP